MAKLKRITDEIKNLNNFKRNGFLVIKDVFTKNEIKFILDSIQLYIAKEGDKLNIKNINLVNNKINSLHSLKKSKALLRFANKNKIKKISRFFLNSDAKVNAIELFAKPAFVGYASPIHQDNAYWCLKDPNGITMWIALSKANASNGGIFYYPGSHKGGDYPHEPSYIKGSSQKVKKNTLKKFSKIKPVTPSLKPGDIVIHDSRTLHGSGKNNSKFSRKGMTIQLFDKNSRVNIPMRKKYLSSLSNQLKQRISIK